MRDAEGGSSGSAQEPGAGTALCAPCGQRDCRSDSGARSSPTPGGLCNRRRGARPFKEITFIPMTPGFSKKDVERIRAGAIGCAHSAFTFANMRRWKLRHGMALILGWAASWPLASLCSQQDIELYQWRSLLPFRQGAAVAEADEKIFCAAGSGLFSVLKGDIYSILRYSRAEGLSDVNPRALAWCAPLKCLVIGYENGNIDLMKGERIVNLNALMLSTTLADKRILRIQVRGKEAWLGCGFGIVKLDLEKEIFRSTVRFSSPLSSEVPVYDIAFRGAEIFAATRQGLYRFVEGSGLLEDFTLWTPVANLPAGAYNRVVVWKDTVLANFSGLMTLNQADADTLYALPPSLAASIYSSDPRTLQDMTVTHGRLARIWQKSGPQNGRVEILNPDGSLQYQHSEYLFDQCTAVISDADGRGWVTDGYYGLFRVFDMVKREILIPDGPGSNLAVEMRGDNHRFFMVSGGFTPGGGKLYRVDGASCSDNYRWYNFSEVYNSALTGYSDFTALDYDPVRNTAYVGIYGGGVLVIKDYEMVQIYDSASTGGAIRKGGVFNNFMCGALTLDDRGALWVGMSFTTPHFAVRKPDGSWTQLGIPGFLTASDVITRMRAAPDGSLWCIVRNKGILAFRHNNYQTITQARLLTTAIGQGKLPTLEVNDLCFDRDGELWVATASGFAILYAPSCVFGNCNFDMVQPVVKSADGFNEILLGGNNITGIAYDGGNRKWMSTSNAGLFLVSPDGYRILQNFDSRNSPLLSDNVLSVAVDRPIGKVYAGTDKGVMMYLTDATEADPVEYGTVRVVPNPVKPDYSGNIVITGLARDAEVKITDSAGHLIFQTVANGGTATWNGLNFNGQRASTGVYVIFASAEDGRSTRV
ncbi:MAG: hypothetical protein NZM15_07680, partial [Flavobacteriales bacterium]|nr:hypothetical protein [Flavobacteriales bacterium]MDW8432566.1 two-component regulator propeller domain-containing protein [Flavobacteriales bacterium]